MRAPLPRVPALSSIMILLLALAAGCGDGSEPGADPGAGGSIGTGGNGGTGGTGGTSGSGGHAGGSGGSPCGDGHVDPWEECDDGEANSDVTPDACRTDCRTAWCGDGVVDDDEDCDDGDGNSDTAPGACRTSCRAADCGDGVVDPDEACDDGADNSDARPDACRSDCRAAWCGDGVVDEDERCDHGDANSDTQANACRTSCEPATCGDGVLDSFEFCDDGDANSDTEPNACRTDCRRAWCGDGVVDQDESCDDGEGNDDTEPGACRTNCTRGFCGDGILNDGEECDGTDLGGATCVTQGFSLGGVLSCRSARCTLDTSRCFVPEICGNGRDDDGNGLADCADPTCADPIACPVCGDGIQAGVEECDDGNEDDGDGCDSSCRVEVSICGALPELTAVGSNPTGNMWEWSSTTSGAADAIAATCSPAGGVEVLIRHTLARDSDVFAKLGPIASGPAFAVSAFSDCADPSTELACNDDMISIGEEASGIESYDLPGGSTLFLSVESPPGAEGDFSLSVILVPILGAGELCDRWGFDDRCAPPLTCQQDPLQVRTVYICR
ncbi:MAG TPA: DUF4215 domain-containing protein [Vulgatibacter sp.]